VKKILLNILILITIAGCSEWLELSPPDELVQDEYWKTREDVEAVLMSSYQYLAQMDDLLFQFGELRADMVAPQSPTTNQLMIMQGSLEPDNTLCKWDGFYKVINYANFVLEFLPVAYERDKTFTEYQRQNLEAEALFIRSLSYFYLVRIFKEVPLVLTSSKTDGQDFFLPKSTEQDIISRIKSDLVKARLIAPGDFSDIQNRKGRATKDAINALLADVCLWNFDYEDCIYYCDQLDEEKYPLIPGSQWFTIFYPGNSLESIFEIQYNQGLDQPNNMYDFTYIQKRVIASEYAQEILLPELSQEIIRGEGSFRPQDAIIWKYAGAAADALTFRPSSELRNANWIIYRYSDILLMKAEALSQLDRFDEAMEIVNRIHERALMPALNNPYSVKGTEDIILEERAREFAFEGKRWYDLLRMGRRNNYQRKSDMIEKMIQNVPSTQKLVLASKLNDPNGWYFPIYIDELEANKNLVQNPYYESFISQ